MCLGLPAAASLSCPTAKCETSPRCCRCFSHWYAVNCAAAALWRVTVGSQACDLHNRVPQRPKVVICDESHYLKGRSSQRTRATTALLFSAARVVLLSGAPTKQLAVTGAIAGLSHRQTSPPGTPALARPVELFPQLHILRPKLFPKFMDFAKRCVCDGRQRCVKPRRL